MLQDSGPSIRSTISLGGGPKKLKKDNSSWVSILVPLFFGRYQFELQDLRARA